MLNPSRHPARRLSLAATSEAAAAVRASPAVPGTVNGAPKTAPVRISFKAQMLEAREEAIVLAASRLLAEKGFDLMTVDQVAADVGIAKASLYKHFSSKEALAAAAMVRVLGVALGGKPRILHVEDDPDIQSIVAAIAEDFADFEFAATLSEARAQLREHRFDLVLLDLALDNDSGWDLFEDIDALDPPPPVIVFSASDVDRPKANRPRRSWSKPEHPTPSC